MPESLNAEHQQLAATCAEFAQQVLLSKSSDDPAKARTEVRAAAKTAGLFAMTQPEAFGGKAAGQLALCVARETLASFNPPYMDAVFGPSPGVLAQVEEPWLLWFYRGRQCTGTDQWCG